MTPSSPGSGRSARRFRDETEEESFASLPDDELLALVSGGGFSAEQSCDAVEEVLRRGLQCPDAIPLMRDLLFGFDASTLRYRAAVCLARQNVWDDDIHRALCHASAKTPVDDPMARSARLQLQKRGLSAGNPPERPLVGAVGGQAQPTKARTTSDAAQPVPVEEPASQPSAPKAPEPSMAAQPQGMTSLPRYTTEDVEEPRLRYRRRKRKRGDTLRQVLSNLQILLLFVVAFVIFLAILGRF